MYNYNHLFYFYATVKSGGVNSAAKHLRISQPSLSSQLKVLESSLDTKLFHKVGRHNELTPEGKVIFGFCRQMFQLSEEMHELVSKQVPYAARRMYIGVSFEVANSFVVEVVSIFLNKYSDPLRPKVTIISGAHYRLVEQLRFRELDAIITQVAMTNSDLVNLEKVEVPVNLIFGEPQKKINFRKSDIASVLMALNKNVEARWVMPLQSFRLRTEIDQFFEDQSLQGRIVFESDVMESIIRSVVDGFGITFLPSVYVPKEIKNKSICLVGPKGGYWKHRIWLACNSVSKEDDLLQSLSLSFGEACKPMMC